MKLEHILYIGSFCLILSNPCFAAKTYSVNINVNNLSGKAGYFNVCAGLANPDNLTICSMPFKIKKGLNSVYALPFPNAYPTFISTSNSADQALPCVTTSNPQQPFSFPGNTENTYNVTIQNFIKNKNGKKIAVTCKMS
jgi:hypothetical protein